MKKVLLTLASIVVILVALGGAGLVGYRYGYRQGINTNITSANPNANPTKPFLGRDDFARNLMPFHNFNGNGIGPGFRQGFGRHGGMIPIGRGFGFFSMIAFFIRIAIFALIIWLAYKLFTGWRVSFTQVNNQKPIEAEPKNNPEEKSE